MPRKVPAIVLGVAAAFVASNVGLGGPVGEYEGGEIQGRTTMESDDGVVSMASAFQEEGAGMTSASPGDVMDLTNNTP